MYRNDFTVAHNGKLYQIKDQADAGRVMVEEKINSKMEITHEGHCFKEKEITKRAQNEKKKPLKVIPKKKKNIYLR